MKKKTKERRIHVRYWKNIESNNWSTLISSRCLLRSSAFFCSSFSFGFSTSRTKSQIAQWKETQANTRLALIEVHGYSVVQWTSSFRILFRSFASSCCCSLSLRPSLFEVCSISLRLCHFFTVLLRTKFKRFFKLKYGKWNACGVQAKKVAKIHASRRVITYDRQKRRNRNLCWPSKVNEQELLLGSQSASWSASINRNNARHLINVTRFSCSLAFDTDSAWTLDDRLIFISQNNGSLLKYTLSESTM